MVITSNTITDKNYKRLSIQISLNGLSFCCRDLLSKQIISFKEIDFNAYPKNYSIENSLWKTFLDENDLTKEYDEVVVLHDNTLNTFVPLPLFDEEYKGSYLQYNTKVFETDYFTFDPIKNYDMVNVYVPYVNINNYLIDQLGTFEYMHSSSILVSKLLENSKNDEAVNMFIHFRHNHFEIVVIQNQKLLLFNSFEYNTPDDFIYYLLFTAEQLHLNPESLKLFLLGDIQEESELFKKAYRYIRNVSLYETELEESHPFSSRDTRRNFILFHS
jgi:hypothetical protein